MGLPVHRISCHHTEGSSPDGATIEAHAEGQPGSHSIAIGVVHIGIRGSPRMIYWRPEADTVCICRNCVRVRGSGTVWV